MAAFELERAVQGRTFNMAEQCWGATEREGWFRLELQGAVVGVGQLNELRLEL